MEKKAMKFSEDFYRKVFDQLFEGVLIVDLQQRITYWNTGAETISGFSSQEVLGQHWEEVLKPTVEESYLGKEKSLLDSVMMQGCKWEVDLFLRHKEGYHVPVRLRVLPYKENQAESIGAVVIFRDNTVFLTARHPTSERQQITDLDPLTNLGNRRFSEVSLGAAVQTYEQWAEPFGVLLIDVDDFKFVNDTYGHDIGDQMLKVVADTLKYSVRTSDYVGRWGGEEFLVVLYEVSGTQIKTIAEKLRRLVEHNSLITEKGEIGVTISIGGTLAQPGDTLRSILARADQALSQSKQAGKNRSTII
jgi:diguanylate cyclase (GGDEF)-like protein/PAS domain S-box-containing protein